MSHHSKAPVLEYLAELDNENGLKSKCTSLSFTYLFHFLLLKKKINKGCESQEGFYKGKETNDASCTAFQSGSLKLRESKEVKMATTLQVKRGRVCLNCAK
jgi:hypothetical protein